MNQKEFNRNDLSSLKANKIAFIYTDGSYNPTTYVIGCAFAFFDEGIKRPYRIAFGKKLKTEVNYGSCIAEIVAVKTAIKAACSLCYSHVIIYHDWNGIEYFSKSENIKSKHNSCPEFRRYAAFIGNAKKEINISFVKVKGHSNNRYNSLVDKMAKSQIMT